MAIFSPGWMGIERSFSTFAPPSLYPQASVRLGHSNFHGGYLYDAVTFLNSIWPRNGQSFERYTIFCRPIFGWGLLAKFLYPRDSPHGNFHRGKSRDGGCHGLGKVRQVEERHASRIPVRLDHEVVWPA